LGSRKLPPRESGGPAQRVRGFCNDDFRCPVSTVFHIGFDRRLVVERYRRAVFEFLVIAKEPLVGAVKWLPAEFPTLLIVILSEIEISPEQRMECDLTESVVRDARVPNGLRASVDARIEHGQDGFILIREQLFQCIAHSWSSPTLYAHFRRWVAIYQLFPNGCRAAEARSAYSISIGSCSACAPFSRASF